MATDLRYQQIGEQASIPTIGLGTWKIPNERTAEVITQAVGLGYRHLDCACDYGNEPEVGEGLANAIQQGICKREDVWLTSKLWNTYHQSKHVRLACERSLQDLKVSELDLYLVHFPISLAFVPFEERYPPGWLFDPEAESPAMKPEPVPYMETWSAMEELVQAGLVKQIGVCNLNVPLLRELLTNCSVRPVLNQVEMHPLLQQPKLKRFCEEQGVAVTAFSPFGADSYIGLGMAKEQDRVLAHPLICELAESYNRTPGQIVLRWGVQRDTIVIPKSASETHLRENLQIYDFELEAEDVARLESLDRHRRFNDPGVFCELAFGKYFPIFD